MLGEIQDGKAHVGLKKTLKLDTARPMFGSIGRSMYNQMRWCLAEAKRKWALAGS